MAEALAREFARVREYQGVRRSGRVILAKMVVEGCLTGSITISPERSLNLSPDDWKDLVKFSLVHMDGQARQELDVDIKDRPVLLLVPPKTGEPHE